MNKFKGYLYNLATDKYRGKAAGIVKVLLFISSVFYLLAVKTLIIFSGFLPCRLKCKVISVGNITLGGTGKTSLVEFIALYLKQKKIKVAVLARGYKRPLAALSGAASGYQALGDEAYMLSMKTENLPVIVDSNRVRAARRASKEYAVNAVILDDGFQQWRIRKDLEILAIDAANPFGNFCLIPRGILREPLSSLKRADVFFLNKVNLAGDITRIRDLLSRVNPLALIVESSHKPIGLYRFGESKNLFSPEQMRRERIAALSGIADPGSFEALLGMSGMDIGFSFRFPDHHRFSEADLRELSRQTKAQGINKVITTEKDAARLTPELLKRSLSGLELWVFRIKLEIVKNEQGFSDRLFKLFTD